MTTAAAAKSVPQQSPSAASPMKSVHIVVQRYRSCKVLLRETDWISVGYSSNQEDLKPSSEVTQTSSSDVQPDPACHCGLLVYVSFASNTDPAVVQQAALTVLNLSVLTTGLWGDGVSSSCSVLELAARGGSHEASLVLVPQANLISKVKSQGKSIQYHGQIRKEQGEQLYDYFVDCVRAAILEEQCRVHQKPLPDHYMRWKDPNNFSTSTATSAASSSTQTQSAPLQVDPSTPPDQMYRDLSKYASWEEETGLPLTDVAGEPLTKSALKKLRKLQEAHAKRHAKWNLKLAYQADHDNNDDDNYKTAAVTATVAASIVDVPAESTVSAAISSAMSCEHTDETTSLTTTPAENAAAPDTDQQQYEWQSAVDPAFCHVVAGSFGKRQGLEMQSDMGPFCHVLQV
jgi:D-Tyr-tRNAtyr deacylase